ALNFPRIIFFRLKVTTFPWLTQKDGIFTQSASINLSKSRSRYFPLALSLAASFSLSVKIKNSSVGVLIFDFLLSLAIPLSFLVNELFFEF
ncbi:MAG: hypothetical protein ACK5RG_13450, partial [Cyclobacteriaceae bacterium]